MFFLAGRGDNYSPEENAAFINKLLRCRNERERLAFLNQYTQETWDERGKENPIRWKRCTRAGGKRFQFVMIHLPSGMKVFGVFE